jgi:uncharacterized protein YjeT (DUF2065 family)
MANAANLTGWLIMATGLYCLAAGLGMASAPDRFKRMFAELEGSPVSNYLAGLVVLVIGIAILLVHPTSTRWPDILVAILGWGALAEGLLFIVAPQVIWAIARPFLTMRLRLWGLVTIAAGIALLALGWCEVGRTTVTLV